MGMIGRGGFAGKGEVFVAEGHWEIAMGEEKGRNRGAIETFHH